MSALFTDTLGTHAHDRDALIPFQCALRLDMGEPAHVDVTRADREQARWEDEVAAGWHDEDGGEA